MNRMADSLEAKREKIQRAVWRKFDNFPEDEDSMEGAFNAFVLHTFDDSVIIENAFTDKYYEVNYRIDGDLVLLGDLQEVERAYVEKRFDNIDKSFDEIVNKSKKSIEIGGPIALKNSPKKIAYAPVLVPGEADSDGDIVTADKIEETAHLWLAGYRNVDFMHSLNNTGVPVESYISQEEMEVEVYGEKSVIPKGSWILACKFSDETWEDIENGLLTGYSIMGVRRTVYDTAIKSIDKLDEAACKRTTLEDLGDDWIAPFVSVVDEPAVPKAKFFAFKSKQLSEKTDVEKESEKVVEKAKEEVTKKGFFDKLKDIINPENNVEKAGRRFSEDTYNSLATIYSEIKSLLEQAEAEREPTNENLEPDIKEANKVDEKKKEVEKSTEEVVEEKEVEKSTEEEVEKEVEKSTDETTEEKEVEKSNEEEIDIAKTLKSISERLEALEKSTEKEEVEEEEVKKEKEEDEEKEVTLDEAVKTIEQLQKQVTAIKSQSNSIPVVNEEKEKEEKPSMKSTRDSFGRAIKK